MEVKCKDSLLVLLVRIAQAAALLVCALAFTHAGTEVSSPARQLIVYTADWCKPCQKLKADLGSHPEVLGEIGLEYREATEGSAVPDIRLMEGDSLVRRKLGYTDLKSFAEWLHADLL